MPTDYLENMFVIMEGYRYVVVLLQTYIIHYTKSKGSLLEFHCISDSKYAYNINLYSSKYWTGLEQHYFVTVQSLRVVTTLSKPV